MGGVAKAVVKPVQQGLEKIGVIKEKQGASPLAELAKTAVSKAEAAAEKPAAQAAAEDTAARRRARRGGRALLSEARIAPETGLQQTLGTGV